ncbi:Ubiquitin carboxyl-terminal hydrolase [Actinidia chinensis var. chinensis]|uniref:Ubiquitin carboxyl-terminal hydrolase n=1 Tax=Actinidia chinensis var. chinensis TaxID=1590841 RepID=A0A2R6QB03_ACTCC|nr:Ubiquitin carboxyl-terminal hydrolase [Actinidia chinensis var. chinensis]
MRSSSCIAFQVVVPYNITWKGLLKRNICQLVLYNRKRECFFSPVKMEGDARNILSNEKQPFEHSTSNNELKRPTENSSSSSVYVNHAAIAWEQNRREWIGDRSRRSKRILKDPIISWSTTYEDLLCTDEPFPESIPLPEMVDFLVDIWHADGLYD